MHLSLAVPSRVLVNNKPVARVTLPGRGGTFGVEKNMPPTVAELRPGVVLVEYEKGDKEEFFVPVSDGGRGWDAVCGVCVCVCGGQLALREAVMSVVSCCCKAAADADPYPWGTPNSCM